MRLKKEARKGRAADGISRRRFLYYGVLAAAAGSSTVRAAAAAEEILVPPRELALVNIHTGESIEACYWRYGDYVSDALAEIDYILRDHRTGEVKAIDRGLLDLLFSLRKAAGSSEPFHVISGYRSAASNTYLRKKSGGVARGSLHLKGKAADIRLPGVALRSLRSAALKIGIGGVGYYPRSDFIHVDVGRIRQWSG